MTPAARSLISPQALQSPALVLQLKYQHLPSVKPRQSILFRLRLQKKQLFDSFLQISRDLARNTGGFSPRDQARRLLFHSNDFLANLDALLAENMAAGALFQDDELVEITTAIHHTQRLQARLYDQFPAFRVSLLAG